MLLHLCRSALRLFCFGLRALLPAQKGIDVNARLLLEYGSHVVGENFFDSVCLFSLLRKKIKPRFAVLYFFGGDGGS